MREERKKKKNIGLGKQEQKESRVVCPRLARTGKDSYFGDTWTGPLGEEKPGLKLLGSPATPNSCVTCGFQNKRGQPCPIKRVIPLANMQGTGMVWPSLHLRVKLTESPIPYNSSTFRCLRAQTYIQRKRV